MIPVVIESPYAGDVEANLRYLDEAIRDCIARGETPYASHKMLTTALDDTDPEQRRLGIEAGLSMARFIYDNGGHVVFYVDRGWSKGMQAARAFYEMHGIAYDVRNFWEVKR